jgi:type I restriction enzyme S subunit
MSIARYPEYKKSTSAFLKELPTGWEVKKVKHLTSRISSGKTPLGGSETYLDEGVIFLRSQNVYHEGLRLDDVVFISEQVDEAMAVSRVQSGDILLNITGASIGRSCVVPTEFPPANVNQHVCAVRLSEQWQIPFVGWFFKSDLAKNQIDLAQNGAAREGLNFDQIGEMVLTMAPPSEHQPIATFLDRETAKIDALVAEQQKLIALLKEKRQAVIAHAVTKGLDPSASMKDSGVAWLGEVPAHWRMKRIKHFVATFEQGWSPQCEGYPVETADEWGVLKVGCVNGGVFRPDENKTLPDELEPVPSLGIRHGDLLISRANTRELVGSAAVAEQSYPNLLLCDKLYRVRFQVEVCTPSFVGLYLTIGSVRGQIELAATGASSSMVNIGQSTILELPIALPPMPEQVAITALLHDETAMIDGLVQEAERAITLLQERRTALITDAVTGKIDVREAVAVAEEVA